MPPTLLPACALAATACRLQSCLLSLKNLKNKLIMEYPGASYCTQNKIQMPFPGVHSPTGQGSSSPFQPQGFVLAVPFAWNVLPLTIHKAWLLHSKQLQCHLLSEEFLVWSIFILLCQHHLFCMHSPYHLTFFSCGYLFIFHPSVFPSRMQGLREQGPCPSWLNCLSLARQALRIV